jgi:hypothetical protein
MLKRGLNRQGQGVFGMSFSMMFSILLIGIVIAVAVYVIIYFLDFNKCVDTGFFYDDLQDEINTAWRSTVYSGPFSSRMPGGADYVCFGSVNGRASNSGDQERLNDLNKDFFRSPNNIFLYPVENGCNIELSSQMLEHVKLEGFFCVPVDGGEIKVKLEKDGNDNLVKLSKG